MSRRRYITTDISSDEKINRLALEHGDFAALLYTWLIPHAEDDAIIRASPGELLAKVVPWRRDKTEDDIMVALSAMESLGLIEWDREQNQIGFPVKSFYKYQSYIREEKRRHASIASKLPETQYSSPDLAGATFSAEQRQTAQETLVAPKVAENSASPSPSPSPSFSPYPPTPPTGGASPAENDQASQDPSGRSPEPITKPLRKKQPRDLVIEALHDDPAWGLPDTPAGRLARVYLEVNPISPYRTRRERAKWQSTVLARFDEYVLAGGEEAVMAQAIRDSPGLQPWDLIKRLQGRDGVHPPARAAPGPMYRPAASQLRPKGDLNGAR